MKRIGVFAGTFDPVHEGHVAFARQALAVGLERVLFLPEPRPRRKQGVHALEHRVAMLRLAIANEPSMAIIELQQARFTPHETIPVLQNLFPGYELCLLFGDDVVSYMVDHIADWPHIKELADSASLVIAARVQDQVELTSRLEILRKQHDLPFRYDFVEPHAETIGSSSIRLAIKRGKATRGLSSAVSTYIHEHKLYEFGTTTS